mgnify:CR=1 FL=1
MEEIKEVKGVTMKKNKKIISIVISSVLVIGILVTAIIATASTKETEVFINVDATELSAGQTATVSVKVTTNYPVATMSIPVFYDKTKIEVSEATATLTDYAVKSAITDAQSADTAKVYANTGVNADEYGFVLVTYIGGAGKDVAENINGEVLTFNVTAKTDVSGTAAIKCVSKSAKTDENVAGMLYFGSPVSGRTINSIPENIENIDLANAQASISIVTGGTTIIANKDLTGVVDSENNYIYGIPAGTTDEDLAEYFTVVNGTFEMVANDAGYTNGTGATLVVKNDDGEEVAQYTLVIFGDVNGDGTVTNADFVAVKGAAAGTDFDVEVYGFAADVNGDGTVTNADFVAVKGAAAGGDNTVNPYA